MERVITHTNGKEYNLDELAHLMEDHDREYVHGLVDCDCSAQDFWDTFCVTFPGTSEMLIQRAKAIWQE